ncbi:MAG TPA: hypothetical protein VGH12_07635 [Steroidobacteraceae bacterium]
MGLHASTVLILGLVITHAAASYATGAPAPAVSGKADKYQVWSTNAVRVLSARTDANSLATAAALSFANHTASAAGSALQLIARAAELAPQSAAIGWLHLQLCAAAASCDARDLATVLRWVDPDNGAAWMAQLTTAHKDKDVVEIDRILADMARSSRFDLYYNQLVVLMFDALSAARRDIPGSVSSSDLATLKSLSAIVSAEIVPPFSALIDSCRESAAASERREDCLKLAKIMQKGDTVIVQIAGFGLEKRFVAPDTKEGRSLAERRHLLEWRLSAAGKLDESILPWTQNARARSRLAEMRLRPREEDVCIALLRARKMALAPTETRP